MTNSNHITRIIIRNVLFIAGFYLLFFYQEETTISKVIGLILLVIAFNAWMINTHKQKTEKSADQ
ncbi:MAG: hypothetical protein P1U56_13045 [Saprospiraceae bacterium]|nr:hypothetical protein [Saprospiraceae bacterium]